MLSTGSQASGVDLKVPEIVRIAVLSCTSTKSVWADRAHTGAEYSAAELRAIAHFPAVSMLEPPKLSLLGD